MNGIEKITARIEADCKAEVAAILAEGQEKAAAIKARYEADAAAQAKAAEESGLQAAQRQLERLESAAQMDAKKQMLSTKQACIDAAFEGAKAKLLQLNDEEYAQLLAKLAAGAAKTGKEEIILNAKDRDRVGELVVSKANGQGAALTLSKETADIEGGLILRSGSVEVNCAFDTQLRVLREGMAAEVAAILFA